MDQSNAVEAGNVCGECVCRESPTLDVLRQVQEVYEDKMRKLEALDGNTKLQKQVELLKSWVSDLVGQNTLLTRAVEEMEAHATHTLHKHYQKCTELERRKASEKKEKELFLMNEALQKEIVTKDKELRQLNKELHNCEALIFDLRKELTICTCKVLPSVPAPTKCDAEVMAGMCCVKPECGEMEPVRDYSDSVLLDDPVAYQDRIRAMETKLKASSKNVRALRKANVTLSVELYATRCVCAALGEECAAAKMNADFKDEIVREMRRQLKQAKAKCSNTLELTGVKEKELSRDYCPSGSSLEAVLAECARGGRGARGRDAPPRAYSDTECRSPRLAAPTSGRVLQ